jgi:TRAP-type C4-dicarboxylate transport system substrate-binding protein
VYEKKDARMVLETDRRGKVVMPNQGMIDSTNLMSKEEKMKRKLFVVMAAVSLLFAVVSGAYAAETIKLKFAAFFPVTHKFCGLNQQFCDEMKKRTDGRVEITHYGGGTLANAPKMFNSVLEGIADLGLAAAALTRGRFPMAEAFDAPMGFPSAWVASHVANDTYEKFKPKEWDKVHVINLLCVGPAIPLMLKKPVRTMEDLRGMKVRSVGRQADMVKALGATPVAMDPADMYEALRRAVLDGAVGPAEMLQGWKLGDLIKYVTVPKGIGNAPLFYIVMNKEKWEKLPNDIQKIFDAVSLEFREKYAVGAQELDIEGIAVLKKNGGQVISLSDAEAKKWEQAVAPVVSDYKKELVSLGYKQAEVDAYVAFIKERTEYWTQQEKEKGIARAY